jgi:hypothetical protein
MGEFTFEITAALRGPTIQLLLQIGTRVGRIPHAWCAMSAGYNQLKTQIQRDQVVKAGARLAQILREIWP